MAITGLHHVLLTVRDLRKSTTFYSDLLGLPKVKDIADDGVAGAKVLYALPDGRLVGLVQHQASADHAFDETHTGLDHLAFSVPRSELPEWEHRFDLADVEHSPAAPSAFGDPLIIVRDPDGIQLQIYGVNPPSEI